MQDKNLKQEKQRSFLSVKHRSASVVRRMNRAAEILEVDRSNLFKKMQKLGIQRKNRESQ